MNTALQWGRGHVTAESKTAWVSDLAYLLASMGPRSRDRGINGRVAGRRKGRGSFNGAAVT